MGLVICLMGMVDDLPAANSGHGLHGFNGFTRIFLPSAKGGDFYEVMI